ncbi:hypothetical protein [Lacimicrobium alkaliphilum]|uniref:Uncharacterized protein n=1 Tax=Lacimicrobium alkaliphilum TaxID=1526571 RepID=A0ABQ1QWE7_9ALTE|nr:hypothetical protein [Lacimicrobium alkaliphilum]GGD49696.1 hypothetical protein GCM10011357_02040 [Lacimicrobium alkaliphilum]
MIIFLLVLLSGLYSIAGYSAEISGLIQVNAIHADNQPSWQQQGTGILRYDQQ